MFGLIWFYSSFRNEIKYTYNDKRRYTVWKYNLPIKNLESNKVFITDRVGQDKWWKRNNAVFAKPIW